ncbi:MAG TPA: UDP-N-acetylmuramoyl-L-alanyl-D-glutamate--2,6-diaminopimelate ligase [Kofleriaceae bacterium]|nr:UDP-N-acetylmuramoyl-L-alanyl-D-glutamate--2,6-diaminopimelate ligase [Kofleriaceae bacterium]
MKLSDLAAGVPGARIVGTSAGADPDIGAVRADSRAVTGGDLFVAVRGRRSDGHAFVATAIAQGAAAVVVEQEQPGLAVPQLVVPDGARALGALIGRAAGDPARRLRLVGITGTNGKTTSTYLAESVVAAAGHRPGVIGTVSYRWAGQTVDAPYTTPTPELLHETFARMADAGCDTAVMEVSSAALDMGRLGGVGFAVAAFSNLTQDHLDVHGTMDAYRAAKQLLFRDHLAPDGVAVVNVDDPEGDGMAAAAAGHRVLRVSCAIADAAAAGDLRPSQRDAEIAVLAFTSTVDGITARIRTPRGELAVASRPLLGHYNVANIALVVGIGEALGLPHEAIARGIADLRGVPGRVERVPNDAGLDVLVDYAHTPDALDNVLRALRPLTRRRLLCVFGCGGDRDPTKRPKMGAVVAALADLAIVTSDNPRTEDPRAIIDMILPAVPSPFFVDTDRRTAIRAAIAEAVPGDIVVIAGKGHEDYQILGTTKIHFDDREEAAAAIAMRARYHVDRIAAALGGTVSRPDVVCARVVIDGRAAAPRDLFVAIKGAQHDGHDFAAQAVAHGATAVMIARGRRHELDAAGAIGDAAVLEVDDPRVGLAGIASGHRARWASVVPDGRIVAITGSAGKTTTKELTRAALAAAGHTHAAAGSLNNETGVPLTVLGIRFHHRFGVVEMGMRGAGQIEYLTRFVKPDVAAIVNAGTAHLELLGSTDAIAEAKGEIYLGLAADGVAVAPADDPRLLALARRHAPSARLLTFGADPGADVRLASYRPDGAAGAALVVESGGRRRELRLGLLGRHAAIDATCALACALGAGVDLDVAISGLVRTRPAAMRGEVVEIGGRRVIVDCYNANPASMTAAITMLGELRADSGGETRALAVVGDMLELGDHAAAAHDDVGHLLRDLDIPLVALGAHKERVARAFGSPALAWTTDDPVTAARAVLAATEPGDWILVKASRGMRLERVVAAMKELAA